MTGWNPIFAGKNHFRTTSWASVGRLEAREVQFRLKGESTLKEAPDMGRDRCPEVIPRVIPCDRSFTDLKGQMEDLVADAIQEIAPPLGLPGN